VKKYVSLEVRRRRFGLLLLLPSIILLLAFFLYPIIYSFYLSLTNTNFFLPGFQSKFIGLENYISLFKNPDFIFSIRISFVYATVSTFIKLLFGFLLALIFQKQIRGFGFFRTIIVIPIMITPICAGLIWKYMMQPGFGLINYFLKFLGITGLNWYTEPSSALISVLLVDIWMLLPFVIVVMMSGLSSLPQELYEAASLDGATWYQKIIHITFPLMKPIIVIVTLINLIDAFKVFDSIWIMTKGGPARATEIFTIFAYKSAIAQGYLGRGAASSIIILFIIIITTLLFIKFSKIEH
jgi:multiple sugar transport system permease protein